MKRSLCVLVCAAFVLTVTGCMTVDLGTGSIRNPVSMSGEVNREYRVVHHFEREIKGWFTLFELVTVRNPRVEEAVREELERSNGDAVVNLTIRGQNTIIDQLIPAALSVLGTGLMSYGLSSMYGYGYGYGMVAAGALMSIGASQISARTYTIEGDVVQYVK